MARHLVRILVAVIASFALLYAAPQSSASLPGEAMYPRTSQEMWQHVQALAASLKLRVEKKDAKRQTFVSRWKNYDPRVFPPPSSLGLQDSDRPIRVQFHVFVTPGHDPARVAVGTILEMDRHVDGRIGKSFGYRVGVIEEWFLRELDKRAGVGHERMAGSIDARREQAARLMPAGSSDPCLSSPAKAAPGNFTRPMKISDVQPIFPAEGFGAGEAVTLVRATITEHGTLAHLEVASPSPKHAFYESSARAATSLWRFEPARIAGCPIATLTMITVNYRLK
jgi:TonB family protein